MITASTPLFLFLVSIYADVLWRFLCDHVLACFKGCLEAVGYPLLFIRVPFPTIVDTLLSTVNALLPAPVSITHTALLGIAAEKHWALQSASIIRIAQLLR